MKTGLVLGGVGLLLLAVYAVAKKGLGGVIPGLSGNQATGALPKKTPADPLKTASSLLTSDAFSKLLGLTKTSSGVFTPAPQGGNNGAGLVGFVTENDLERNSAPSVAGPSIVTEEDLG